jgi:tetratricopeptide (TPR) repeat protein
MVASRLLVEAYLRQGRAEEARQRLRIYSLLNDSDPEIAELRRRIGELDRRHGEGSAAAPEAQAEPEPDADSGRSAEPEWSAEPELGDEPPASTAENGEPFPGLAEPSSRRRYLEALAAGELFEVEEEPAGDQVFELGAPAGAPGPDLSSLLEPGPEAGGRPTVTLGRLYLRQGHTREAQEIFREVLARDPGNDEARRHLEELERPPEDAAPPSVERPPEQLSSGPPEEPTAPALEARDLLEGRDGGEGLTGRKRYVLERYLERLRGRARRDVH